MSREPHVSNHATQAHTKNQWIFCQRIPDRRGKVRRVAATVMDPEYAGCGPQKAAKLTKSKVLEIRSRGHPLTFQGLFVSWIAWRIKPNGGLL